MEEDTPGRPSGRRATVDEAARALGLSVDAIRKRVQRGTIDHEKDRAGRVRIILDSQDDASTLQDERPDITGQLLAAKDETIEELRGRVRRLEHELDVRNEEIRRRDHLLAAALERIPELEAPKEPQNQPESAENRSDRGTPPQEPERGTERPWWRRLWGG
jgi:excisionase family DNA binding protein